MLKFNPNPRIFILSALVLLFIGSKAQTVSFGNNGSDFFLTSNWAGIAVQSYPCGNYVSWAHIGLPVGDNTFADFAPNLPTGSHTDSVGPGITRSFILDLQQSGDPHGFSGNCSPSGSAIYFRKYSDTVVVSTQNIHDVASLSSSIVTTAAHIQLVHLSWTKGSDIPDRYVWYRIYRGGIFLDSVSSAGLLQYTDSTLLPTNSYTYTVTSYTPGGVTHGSGATSTWTWPAQESPGTQTNIYVTNNLLNASDGTYYGKTQLTWNNLASFAPNDIAIYRDSMQLLVVNKNTTSYADFDGVAGVRYKYTVAPINANNQMPITFIDSGNSRPNGVLSGYVKSLYSSAVPNVIVTATATVDGYARSYSDTTDVTGYYSIQNIFYDNTADYVITAARDTDKFSPASVTRNLNTQVYNVNVSDITDTTVFTIQGKVKYAPITGQTCDMPVAGALVYVNGSNSGVVTAADGTYKYSATVLGNYTVAIKYYDHTFNYASRTIFVSDNSNSHIDFLDTKVDTLILNLKNGCGGQLCDYALFNIQSSNGCIDSNSHFLGYMGGDTLILPAAKYTISLPNSVYTGGNSDAIVSTSPPLGQLNTISVDLTHRDTSYYYRYDTTYITVSGHPNPVIDTIVAHTTPHHSANFVYHGPLSIDVQNVPLLCNVNDPHQFLVGQSQHYYVQIHLKETNTFAGQTSFCYHDTGTVNIDDEVSGAGLISLPLTGGRVIYDLVPGSPKVPDASTSNTYEKYFNVTATSGSQFANFNGWMLITGIRSLTPTINTTPAIPFMVLHDPPGSASFSSLEKDSSVSLNLSLNYNRTFAAGGIAQVQLGYVEDVAGESFPGPYGNLQLSGTNGSSVDGNQSSTITFTAKQTISTSSDPNYVGFNGDVFIGSSLNMKYAKAYQLSVDNTCMLSLDTVLSYGIDSVNTQFIYSVYDLRHSILPNLYSLLAIAPASNDSIYNKAYFQNQINVWLKALSDDSASIANFQKTSNVTYSAGTSDDYSAVADSNFQYTNNFAATTSFNQSFVLGISDGNNVNVNLGDQVSLNTTNSSDTNAVIDRTTTFTYHLEDDVAGNFYSVDIGHDKHFGSPIFRLFGGTSACPWEPGTQPRDEPEMTIAPASISNVPANTPASFIAYLSNYSESNEQRTYMASISPESNPQGATVMMGGQNITQFPGYFTIGPNNTLPVVLTVTKGPFAADYNIDVNFGSSCDSNINVLKTIHVNFQNDCSPVSVIQPTDGWLLNANNRDTLRVKLSGYNQSNPNLREIGLQYRLVGSNGLYSSWSTFPANVIDSADINPIYTNSIFYTASLPDGNYQLQAYAKCGSGINTVYTYSTPLNGVIDRHSFTLYGTPTPANGVLNLGDNIGLQFNEGIDCNQTYEHIQAVLTRNDNGQALPTVFTCFGNGLILSTFPDTLINSLDGVTLTATVTKVHDVNGNGLTSPITWSFLVNRSKTYWAPSTINTTATLGTSPTVTASLVNVGPLDSFTIVQPSRYMSLVPPTTLHIAAGTPQAPYTDVFVFNVLSSLNQGQYADTIIILVGGKREYLYVNIDVVTQAPNWSVNPANFQNSMSITANYSTTHLNAPLSSDTRDIIAAFVGDQCRGVGHIIFDAVSDTYSAFITAYSNTSSGDTFSFRIWDALPGIEYHAAERLPFVLDGSIGQPLAPYILHTDGVYQTIKFTPGWNWFSLNVTPADMSTNSVLSSITGNNGATVKSQSTFDQFTTAATGWTGGITTFNTHSSYMINLDHADTLHLLGQPVVDTTIVQLQSGWNWVGFPRHKIATATSYLQNVNASVGDILKSETQYTQYTGSNWAGSMNFMYPGQGYKMRNNNAFNFVIPPDRSLPSWNTNAGQFQQNMTVTADLQFDGLSVTQSHFLVGAFANGICIGTAQPEYINNLNVYRVFMAINGDSANARQSLSFKVYDTDNDIEYTPIYTPVSVSPDTTVARVEAPYVINVQTSTGINALKYTDGFSLLQNVPNPFARTTSIQYTIPSAQQVTLTLYDESGRLIRELVNGVEAPGDHTISFEQDNLQGGVYFYQMKSGDFVKTRRMLILQ